MKNMNMARLRIELKPSGFLLILESDEECEFSVNFFALGSRAYQLSSSVEGYFSEQLIDVRLPFAPLRVGITNFEIRSMAGISRKAKIGKKAAGRKVHLHVGSPLQMLPIYAGQGRLRGRFSSSGYSGYSAYSSYSMYSGPSRHPRGSGKLEFLPAVKIHRPKRRKVSKARKRVQKVRKTNIARRNLKKKQK